MLVEHFLAHLAAEYGQAKKQLTSLAIEKLTEYDWPGNIRELKNLIERLVIMSPDDEIGPDAVNLRKAGVPDRGYDSLTTLKAAREAFEKDHITKKLSENNWNETRTAEALGIERSNLHRKIKAYDIKLP